MSLMRKLQCNLIVHFDHFYPGPKTDSKQSNRKEQSNVLVSIFFIYDLEECNILKEDGWMFLKGFVWVVFISLFFSCNFVRCKVFIRGQKHAQNRMKYSVL